MLSINISELIWTIINFFLLYFLLKRFLYGPILRHMDARRERLDKALEAEKAAEERIQETEEQIEREKRAHRDEADELIAAEERAAAARSAEALSAARTGAESALADGQSRLEESSARERAALQEETDALAELLAQNILGGSAAE